MLRESIDRRRWPRRRARLPGRGRVTELVRHPTGVARRLRPDRLRRIGRIGDDERLIGLMMIRDEADIVEASLRAACRWFDRILVLDGTTDPEQRRRTDEVLDARPEVVFVARDEDLPGSQTRDGARQYLLEEARRRYGVENWIGVLHADECIDQDPRPVLAAHHPALDPSIRVRLVHAFLHADDEQRWPELAALPVRDRIRHVMWPGVPESRFFFDTGDRDYEVGRHAKVIPRSFRAGPLVDGFVIVQYNERSPDQVMTRARQRAADGWQVGHYARFLGDDPEVFTTSLDRADAPFAPEFAGDPEGPFRPVHLDQVPHGPEPDAPPPLLLVDRGRSADDGPDSLASDRRPVDLTPVYATDGLLDLVAAPRRRAARRWYHRMTAMHVGGWGHTTVGDFAPPPGYLALLRQTALVLGSRRTTLAQRRTAAGELVRRLHDPASRPHGWCAWVPEDRADDLLAILPNAVVDPPPAPAADHAP